MSLIAYRMRPASSIPDAMLNFAWLVWRGLRYYWRYGLRATIRKITGLPGYKVWWRLYGRLSPADRTAIGHHITRFERHPLLSVVMPVYDTPELFLRRAIASVSGQLYPHWELVVVDDASKDPAVGQVLEALQDPRIKVLRRQTNEGIVAASNQALAVVTGEFVVFLDHDDELSPDALYVLANEIITHPDAGLIYSDEDKIDAYGRHYDPYFKPDWNEDFFFSQNFVNHLCAIRRGLLDVAGGFRPGFDGGQDYDLVLRVVEHLQISQIRHLPQVLYHWRMLPSSFSHSRLGAATGMARRAVVDHLARRGKRVEVTAVTEEDRYQRVRYFLPDPPPRVSVVIPTRDRVDLLRQCVSGLLDDTDYRDLEILIIDNGSREPETLRYFQEVQRRDVRVLPYPGPFNYSAINNFGARHATGSLLCLLNNDIKIIHSDWLTEMASQAVRPEIGAVGAKLYFADGTLQHAGVVIGLGGVAGHISQLLPKKDIGNHQDVNLVREVSCVTAACLVLRKEIFDAVGGLDEGLPVSFNDVDFCLRIRAMGWRILWTPFAELYHLESASRGLDLSREQRERFRREQAFMRERWGDGLNRDPFYNPNLTLESARGGLAFPPRAAKPWLS